jgi:hypothetical protein
VDRKRALGGQAEEPPVHTVHSLHVPSLLLEEPKQGAADERPTLVPDHKISAKTDTQRSAQVTEEMREGVKLVDPTPRIAILPRALPLESGEAPRTQVSPQQAPAASNERKATGPLGTTLMTPSPGLPADAFAEPTKQSAGVGLVSSPRLDRPVGIRVAHVPPGAIQTLPVSAARLGARVLPFATPKAAGSRAWRLMLALCVAIPGIALVIWQMLWRP